MEKSNIIGTAAIAVGALITLISVIFLRGTDFYAFRWIGGIVMVGGFSYGPAYTASKNKNSHKKDTR